MEGIPPQCCGWCHVELGSTLNYFLRLETSLGHSHLSITEDFFNRSAACRLFSGSASFLHEHPKAKLV